MTHLIAKLRMPGRSNKYRKILSLETENIYALPNGLESAIDYDPKYLLDEDEWFSIASFSTQEYCGDIIGNSFNSVDYDMLDKSMFSSIDFICSYQDGDFYFQNVPKSRLVLKKGFFYIGQRFQYEDNFASLLINEYPDALYRSGNDTLYFRKLSAISSIFKGIDQLYREATEEEVERFLQKEFITLTTNFSAENVGKRNRQRIALASDTLDSYQEDEKELLLAYIHEYRPDIKTENDAFLIGNEDELKYLLFGIEQQYYTTVVRKEKRVANSISPLKTSPGALP